MISNILISPKDVLAHIRRNAKNKRLFQNLTQQSLSEQSGVSLGVIKKFERTGKISLESLLKLALTLGCLNEFTDLFKPLPPETFSTLDEILKQKARKRGRK
jgi:transcriptional regulator with XRE-family HTH domain